MASPFDDEAKTKISPATLRLIAGRYRLGRFLAAGGFATVHEGSYSILDQERRVAIKLMKATAEVDPASKIRFREEVKTLCLLDDPNICKVIDGGIDGVTMFLVMDFADGGSLKTKLEQSPTGRIAAPQATVWMTEAARGLLAAEQNRAADGTALPVIHRDVKPANLLLKQGRVVVADFGAAKLGGDNQGVTCDNVPASWTPDFGSPEQRTGFVDQRSDIYSLGASFYQLLTGKVTRERFAHPDERFKVAHDPRSVCADVPADLADLIRRMTEPDPRQRPQSFADVLEALEQMRRQPVSQWALRALLAVVALVSVGILLLVLGVIPPFWQSDLDPNARTLQEEKSICEEFGKQLAALRPRSWEHLDDVQKRFEAAEQKLARNRERLAQIEGAGLGLDQRPRLGDAYVQQGPLSQEVQSLKNVPAYCEVRDQLVALQGRLPKSSTQAASTELARANETLASLLLPSRPLRDLCRRVEESVADCKRERAEQVAVLRRRLDGGDLQQLPAAARDVAKAMQACDEGDLTAVAEGIAASAERAAAIANQLPKWPPAGREGGTLDTATFGDALDALARLDATNRDADLKAWWQRFADQARSQWSAQVTAAFTRRVAEVQARVAEFNVKADKARAAGSADDALRRELTNVEEEINRIDRTREELDRLCERHQLPIELRRVLLTRTGTLSPLRAPAVNFEDYEKLLSECVLPEAVDPAIAAARTELAQRRESLQQELGAAKSADGRPEIARLTAASSALRETRMLFDQAVETCRTLRNLPKAFDTRNVLDMRIECQANQATKKYADLERLRASTLEEVEKLATARTAAVESLEEGLRSGTDQPARIAEDAKAVAERMANCAEGQLAERARAIADSARLADELQASVPLWRPQPALGRSTDDLKACVTTLKNLEGAKPRAGDASLRAWWTARRKAIVAAACADIAARWQAIQSALERAVGTENADSKAGPGRDALVRELAAAQELRSELLALGGRLGADFTGPSQLKLVAELDPLRPEAAGVTFPAGWPTRQFRAPAGVQSLEVRDNDESRRLYADDFRAKAAEANLRLWYFAERRDGQGPVYMAYCENKAATRACLVDVHPVTLREISVYFDGRADYESELENFKPETLAFNSSWRIADAFARLIPAAGGTRYTLPPEDWRDWPRCQAFGPLRAVVAGDDVKPTLKVPFEDVAIGGFAYLRSGVLEWTENQQTRGVSEIRAPAGIRGARRIEVGFRLALDLVPVAR